MRKFLQKEIDLIYDEIQSNEEMLWRGKPKLIPNLAFLSTLFLVFITDIIILTLRVLKITSHFNFSLLFTDWFLLFLFLIAFATILFMLLYVDKYYKEMMNTFYVITNSRLLIFDSEKEKISFSKLYPTIKVLRLKKTIFDSGTVVFDVDIIDDRLLEIGFKNIDDAKDVLDIIKHQLQHMRNKS